MSESKTSAFMDKFLKVANKLDEWANIPVIQAIQNGMIATTAPIIIGSIFLILSILAQPDLGSSKVVILPFLTPFAKDLNIVNSMTLGFIGLYASFTIAKSYGDILKVDGTQTGLIGLISFFFITYTGPTTKGLIDASFFGANGMFVAMLTSLLSVKLYSIFIKKGFTIKLPSNVPPKVGDTFASVIPMFVIVLICWLIRTVANFNLASWIYSFLTPILNGSDTVWGFFLLNSISIILWAFGLNGPTMLGGIIIPITTADLAANAAAKMAGNPLPHIFTYAFWFSFLWIGAVWPVVIWYLLSKNKGKRALGIAAAPALCFNIIEPIMFGAPVVMNPILMVPFIFNGIVGPLLGYLSVAIGFVSRPFAEVPWASPAPISGILVTGDWKILIVQAIELAIGLITYYPFIRVDIRNSEAKAEMNAEAE